MEVNASTSHGRRNPCRAPPRDRGAPRPLREDARRASLVELVRVLPERASERQQSGGGGRRRRPLHGGGPSCSSPITPLEWPHSFNNPDHVSIVIHNYGGGSDWLRASRDTTIWKRLSDASVITVPPLRSKVMRMDRRIQTQCLREKILGQIFASDYQGRHRAQSASGSATGLRQGCRRRQWLLTN